MEIKKIMEEEVAILALKGNFLCEPDKMRLREQLYGLMNENIRNVIIDLGKVDCVNSEGVGTLVMALTSLRKTGGDLRLAHVSDMVRKTLTITQLVRVFEIYDTADEAIASFKIKRK